MTDFANEVAELEAILHDYTVFFIIFDVVFTVMLFLGVILGIKFIKSKKKLLESNEYLSYTIQGQEEERPASLANCTTPLRRICATARIFPKRRTRQSI